jgi:hypothetical protein
MKFHNEVTEEKEFYRVIYPPLHYLCYLFVKKNVNSQGGNGGKRGLQVTDTSLFVVRRAFAHFGSLRLNQWFLNRQGT